MLLVFVGSAGAAVRYAAPSGAGASPCNPTACSLKVAIEGAQNGDEVVVGPGVYAQSTPISVSKAITVGGTGEVTPFVGLEGVELEVDNPGASVHDLRLTLTKVTMTRPFVLIAGSAERVIADGAGLGGGGCLVENGMLRDSVCIDGLTVEGIVPGSHQATIANVTADPIFVGASTAAHMETTIVNTIAYPAPRPNTSKAGLLIDVIAGASADAVIRNSNFNEVDSSLSAGGTFTYTPAGTNGNQTAPPLFVDFAHGDLRPLPTSPTIDAGVVEPLIGATDLLGLPRVQPRCIGGTPVPDIGAYEFQPTEVCPGGPAAGGGALAPIAHKKRLAIGKVRLRLDPTKGAGVLTVAVPAAGKVSLSGKGIVAAGVTAKKAGNVRLPVQAKGRQAGRLARTGKVKLTAIVTERLGDGARLRKSVPVTLRQRLPR